MYAQYKYTHEIPAGYAPIALGRSGELSRMRPFFKENGVTLYLRDCVRGMTDEIRQKSVDVVVTSPPYNIGIGYGHYKDLLPRDDYLQWIDQVGLAVKRVLADQGSFFLNVGGIPKDPWVPFDIAQTMRRRFVLQNVFHWIKSIAIMKEENSETRDLSKDVLAGHYKPIGGNRFVNDCHEYVFQFTKEGVVPLDRLAVGVPYKDKSNIGRWESAKKDLRCRGNSWFIPYRTIWDKKQRPHPSTFPTALPEMCMKIHGLARIKLVMDPFMGIGTTAVASMNLKKKCVGFEIDREYLLEAALRLGEVGGRPEARSTKAL